jgi:hypothetical protein
MEDLKDQWQPLKGKIFNLNPQENTEAHRKLVADLIGLISHVGDTSNLILDPVLESYYLMAPSSSTSRSRLKT